jgi:EpsI family protein
VAGAAVFQFFGNANHGYIDTASLFYWWGYQWFQWGNPNAENQHAPLILALSAWLLWRNLRTTGEETPGARSSAGDAVAVGAMAAGLVLHALGFAVQQARISVVALLVFAWGVLAWGGGRKWARAAAFPLAFLVFAIPLNILDSVGFWLRLTVIKASSGLAHAVGIEVLRNGTQLLAPDGRYQYDVAAACSGVRSLMALAALSLLIGYLTFRPGWLRAVVLLLCVPFTYLGNVARIASIIFAAQWGGQRWGEVAHEIMGFGVFVIVLGGILLVVEWLRRIVPAAWLVESRGAVENPGKPATGAGENPGPNSEAGGFGRKGIRGAVVAIVGLAVLEMAGFSRLTGRPLAGDAGVRLAPGGRDPVELPAFLGTDWIGRATAVTAVEREILPPDTGYSRKLYVPLADPSHAVFFSIVLSGRDRTSIHRPELCLVGQGWTIDQSDRHRFAYPASMGGSDFPATMLHVQREVTTPRGPVKVPQLVCYWFVSSDRVVATHWQRFASDAWDRLRHWRADRWAYVLLQTDAADGEAAALARLQAVLSRTLPAIQSFPKTP